MPERPVAVLAMQPWALPDLFPADLLTQLRALVRLEQDTVLTSFRTAAVLRTVDVLITGWGAPRIDRGVLTAAPRLRAVIHAAGSVKRHVDPAVFAKGVTVSSAAQANAVPVAEYTVAALVFAAKRVFARAHCTHTTATRVTGGPVRAADSTTGRSASSARPGPAGSSWTGCARSTCGSWWPTRT